MKNKLINNFSVIIVNSKMKNFGILLKEHKRITDIFIEINKSRNIYILVGEKTEIDGSYYFIKRLPKESNSGKYLKTNEHVICTLVISVKSVKFNTEDIVVRLIDIFHKFKNNELKGNIVYKSTYFNSIVSEITSY